MVELTQFFILSTGSAGSTLLQALLDAHPKIRVPIEGRLYIHLNHAFRNYTARQWELLFSSALTEPKVKNFWNIDEFDLGSGERPDSFKTGIQRLVLESMTPFEHDEVKVIGDKNPVNSYFIKQLYALYPNLKIIHLVRDLPGFINSAKKLDPNLADEFLKLRWSAENQAIAKFCDSTDIDYVRIRYEDLISNPIDVLSRICQLLGLHYDDKMITFHKQVKNVFPDIMNKLGSVHPKSYLVKDHLKKLQEPISDRSRSQNSEFTMRLDRLTSSLRRKFKYDHRIKSSEPPVLNLIYQKLRYWFYKRKIRVFYNVLGFKFRVIFWKIKPF